MDLFLFANFFPYQKAEPFLVNEIPFAKKHASHISVLTLYGSGQPLIETDGISVSVPVFKSSSDKKAIFFKGLFNLAPFHIHLKELFTSTILISPRKLYWFFTSLFLTRAVLSSPSYKAFISEINSVKEPVLYFYWGDNLAWIIPYLKKKIPSHSKIVIRLHGSDLYEGIKAHYAPLRRYVFSDADLIFTVSENGKQYLKEKYPAQASKIFCARLGVSDNGTGPFSNGIVRVVSVSNLVPLKRVRLIFNALQLLQLPVEWHHFGDGPLKTELSELVKAKRKGLDVTLHGFMPNKDILDFYRNNVVNLFINVSTTEGVPVSIMEALSFGIPVVATDVGGTSELVDNSVGRLVPADINAGQLASELAYFLNLPEGEVKLMRQKARHYFESKASADKNYELFYKQLTG